MGGLTPVFNFHFIRLTPGYSQFILVRLQGHATYLSEAHISIWSLAPILELPEGLLTWSLKLNISNFSEEHIAFHGVFWVAGQQSTIYPNSLRFPLGTAPGWSLNSRHGSRHNLHWNNTIIRHTASEYTAGILPQFWFVGSVPRHEFQACPSPLHTGLGAWDQLLLGSPCLPNPPLQGLNTQGQNCIFTWEDSTLAGLNIPTSGSAMTGLNPEECGTLGQDCTPPHVGFHPSPRFRKGGFNYMVRGSLTITFPLAKLLLVSPTYHPGSPATFFPRYAAYTGVKPLHWPLI